MTEALVFISQFILILLMGLQSLNIRDGRYIPAAITSFLIGVFGYYITAQIAIVQDMFTTVWWFYVIAGPLGIVTSIWLHPKLVKLLTKKKEQEQCI